MPRACVLSQQSHTMQAKALKNEPLLKGALGHHDPSEVILAVVCPVCDGGPVPAHLLTQEGDEVRRAMLLLI